VRIATEKSLLSADGEVFDGDRDFRVAKHATRLRVYAPA
jgi:hypothetical protein